MNAAAYTGAWLDSPPLTDIFQKDCMTIRPDAVIYISTGPFLSDGTPSGDSPAVLAGKALQNGADMVLRLPVIAMLSGPDTQAFATLTLYDCFPCIRELIVPVSALSSDRLEEIAMFLFKEPLPYQKHIRLLMGKGMKIDAARLEAIEAFLPGAASILRNPFDSFAVELRLAALRTFSRIKLRLIRTDGSDVLPSGMPDASPAPEWDARLARHVSELLSKTSPEELRAASRITPSCPWMLSEKLLSCRKKLISCDSFLSMAHLLEEGNLSEEQVRRGLLMLLLNIRLPNLSIAGLDAFCSYIRVDGLTKDADRSKALLDELKKTGVGVIFTDENIPAFSGLDESRIRLAGFDLAADALV